MEVLSFLTCEDIRLEQNGKVTLVGCYDGLVLDAGAVTAWPGAVRFAANLRVQTAPNDPVPDSVSLSLKVNNVEIVGITQPIAITRPDRPTGINVPMTMVAIERAPVTEVVVEVSFNVRGERQFGPYIFRTNVEVNNLPP